MKSMHLGENLLFVSEFFLIAIIAVIGSFWMEIKKQ